MQSINFWFVVRCSSLGDRFLLMSFGFWGIVERESFEFLVNEPCCARDLFLKEKTESRKGAERKEGNNKK